MTLDKIHRFLQRRTDVIRLDLLLRQRRRRLFKARAGEEDGAAPGGMSGLDYAYYYYFDGNGQ